MTSERQNKDYSKKIKILKVKKLQQNFNIDAEFKQMKKNFKRYPPLKQKAKEIFLKEIQREENINRLKIKRDPHRIGQIGIHTYLSGISRRQYNTAQTQVSIFRF